LIEWTLEVKRSLKELKKYLASPPVRVASDPGELLLRYGVATNQVVSAVPVVEREEPMTKAPQSLRDAPEGGSAVKEQGPPPGVGK
jgi:hypothetical protein